LGHNQRGVIVLLDTMVCGLVHSDVMPQGHAAMELLAARW
jgi:hypothetical protein